MSHVEAASADPTVWTSRASTPVMHVAPEANIPSQSAEEFASVFALTRQSLTWLNGLLNRRVDQIAAGRHRQQRVNDALSCRARNEAPRRARQDEPGAPGKSATRADRLRASARDRTQTVDRAPANHSDHQGAADAGRAHRHAAAEAESVISRRPQQPNTSEHTRGQAPETAEPQPQQHAHRSAEQEAATTAGPVHAAGSGDAASSSSLSTNVGGRVPVAVLNAEGPTSAAVQTQAGGSVQSVQVAMGAASAKGGETGSAVSQDLMQASTAAKTAEGAAKPTGVTLDFQNILQHAGRARAAGPTPGTGLPTTSGKVPIGETVKLAGSESVQQLARVVRSNLGGRHATMVLRLDPPELGQLRVDIRMHDQMLLLRFQAETQAGHDALQMRLTDLRIALQQHGIQLDRVEVEFRPPPPPGSEGGEADGRQYHQDAPGGGDSPFGHARGHDGSASGSSGSSEFPGPPGETEPEMPPVGNNEPADDDVARPAETGVDLIV